MRYTVTTSTMMDSEDEAPFPAQFYIESRTFDGRLRRIAFRHDEFRRLGEARRFRREQRRAGRKAYLTLGGVQRLRSVGVLMEHPLRAAGSK